MEQYTNQPCFAELRLSKLNHQNVSLKGILRLQEVYSLLVRTTNKYNILSVATPSLNSFVMVSYQAQDSCFLIDWFYGVKYWKDLLMIYSCASRTQHKRREYFVTRCNFTPHLLRLFVFSINNERFQQYLPLLLLLSHQSK